MLVLIGISGIVFLFNFFRYLYFLFCIKKQKKKLIRIKSSEDIHLSKDYALKILNPHTSVKAVSSGYFILKTENSLLEAEIGERPITWQYVYYFTVVSEIPMGVLRLVTGTTVTIRLSSSEEVNQVEYIGYFTHERDSSVFWLILSGILLCCFWIFTQLSPNM